jgi:hypothetical protein
LDQTLSVLSSANRKLESESQDLEQPSYIRQVARWDGLVGAGQVAYSVLPSPAGPQQAGHSSAGAAKRTPSPWYAPLEFWDRL